jgi:hypothetical protein
MKRHSTDARIISAFLRDTWLRDQQHATFTELIRLPPNHADNRGGHDAALRAEIISAIADRKAEAGTPSTPAWLCTRRPGEKFANSILVL